MPFYPNTGKQRLMIVMRASYNGNTQASQACAVGSIPIARSSFCLNSIRINPDHLTGDNLDL